MSTFVLVHGAWHGGWCWYKLVARLEARGHRVLAPDLPGHGADRSLVAPATYRDYVDRIAGLLRQESDPVALVGHSMGGAVITGVAEAVPEKVAKLVYLAAFLAPSGRTMAGDAKVPPTAAAGLIVPALDGRTTTLNPAGVRAAFYADCADEDVALARLCVTPQALEPLTTPVTWTQARWGRVARAYIACSEDAVALDAEARRAFIESLPGTTDYLVLKASHSPFFSMPDQLADTLEHLLV